VLAWKRLKFRTLFIIAACDFVHQFFIYHIMISTDNMPSTPPSAASDHRVTTTTVEDSPPYQYPKRDEIIQTFERIQKIYDDGTQLFTKGALQI
jgi:hypothetical protein